jgi:hypothetical protein
VDTGFPFENATTEKLEHFQDKVDTGFPFENATTQNGALPILVDRKVPQCLAPPWRAFAPAKFPRAI